MIYFQGNLKPRKRTLENSTRFSNTVGEEHRNEFLYFDFIQVPNSRGHDYGWRLQSSLGQEIQNLQIRFDHQHKKRVPNEVLGSD